MKNQNMKNFVLVMALCISAMLSGCTTNVSDTLESNKSAANSLSHKEQAKDGRDTRSANFMAEAYENDEMISLDEQEKAEETRRAEIAEQYSIYEPYGMSYDEKKDRFYYNGQIVRYFKDEVSTENTNSFFFDDGVVDIEPMKDTDGNLTGLKQSSDADFKARSEKQEEINLEFDVAGNIGNSGSFELGDPNERDDSLDTYTAFGVCYDQTVQKWMYDGKVIHILYDEDYNIYCNASASDGTNLKVIRDKNGNIEEFVETDVEELEQYVK